MTTLYEHVLMHRPDAYSYEAAREMPDARQAGSWKYTGEPLSMWVIWEPTIKRAIEAGKITTQPDPRDYLEWLQEHAPSGSFVHEHSVANGLLFKAVIPDPDEAFAYRNRWT